MNIEELHARVVTLLDERTALIKANREVIGRFNELNSELKKAAELLDDAELKALTSTS